MHRLAVLAVSLVPAALAAQQPVRGFPPDALPVLARRESLLRQTPDTARLRADMLHLAAYPHHAGSARSRENAEWALAQFRSYGLEARIDTFQALMPWPTVRRLDLVAPTTYTARLQEPAVPGDSFTSQAGQLPVFHMYSADGDVTADLVFVNYGLPEDYDVLARLGVDVRGKIVIAKYGRSWRGIKPKVAAEHGAIGCIIYSDPRDDGYWVNDVYPTGPMRPEFGAQRGSVEDMPTYPGDPLTPGWGNRPGGRMLPRDSSPVLMRIPVLPIGYGDALPLLRALGGPVVPDDWKGALPITYHAGPGPARVHLQLAFDWQVRPLYDVIARIPGTVANQWVVWGNHHDAWVNGASDPLSGAVTLLEAARSFGELRRTGWRPRRTIVLALWDGEEPGLLGSTEWAEANADLLKADAVAYFNSDGNTPGRLGVSGSHTLESFFREVARDTPDPNGAPDEIAGGINFALKRARTAQDSNRARTSPWRIGALGSGSDYTAFIDHLGIASSNTGHGGAVDDGIYHSIYDDYTFYARFLDTSYVWERTQSALMGAAVLRMADAPVLPFSFSDAAATYGRYLAELDTLVRKNLDTSAVSLAVVRQAVDSLRAAGARFDTALARATAHGEAWLAAPGRQQALTAINRDVYESERDLTDPRGLPRRPWFEHMIYAPGFYTGYGVKTMPGIREAVEQKNPAEANAGAAMVAGAIDRMAARASRAAAALNALR